MTQNTDIEVSKHPTDLNLLLGKVVELRKLCDSSEQILLALRWFEYLGSIRIGGTLGTFLEKPELFSSRASEGRGFEQAEQYILKAYREALPSLLIRAKELATEDFSTNDRKEKELTGQIAVDKIDSE